MSNELDDDPFDMEDCEVKKETDKAFLVLYGEPRSKHWIAKSQIEYPPTNEIEEGDTELTITISGFLAREKGFV